MPRIFISYRLADSRKTAGHLYQHLVKTFGSANVIKDINVTLVGSDAQAELRQTVASCDVLLAVIGQHWLTVTDDAGNRKLNNPNDFLRIEIAEALRPNRCSVIPVLVDNATMPRASDLPSDLRPLAQLQPVALHSEPKLDNDIHVLVQALEAQFGSVPRNAVSRYTRPDDSKAVKLFYELFDKKRAEIRDHDYALIRWIAKSNNPRRVWEALQVFWKTYPKYDPDNFARFKPKFSLSRKAVYTQHTCTICGVPLQADEEVVLCPNCKMYSHSDCWDFNKRCGSLRKGCGFD